MTYEENVDANLFAVRSLAFALLECRSEKEALQVLKYFARPKSPVVDPKACYHTMVMGGTE